MNGDGRPAAGTATKKNFPACARCADVGFFRRQKDGYDYIVPCPCRTCRQRTDALAAAGIPKSYRETTLERPSEDGREPFHTPGPKVDPTQHRAYETCLALRDTYLAHFLRDQEVADLHGLLLYGPSGRGKTRLAASLLGDLIHAGLHDVRFIGYPALFKQIRYSYENKGFERLFHDLVTARVLVIDDFGLDVSDRVIWVQDNIGYIINERYGRRLPTVLTTSAWRPIGLAPTGQEDDERHHIAYRLRSRIAEMCYELKIPAITPPKRIIPSRSG